MTVMPNDYSEMMIDCVNSLISAKETGVRAGGVVVNRETIREGLVVLVDGYEIGLTFVCFASGLSSAMIYPHLNPLNSHFYTDVYRWVLRYISV